MTAVGGEVQEPRRNEEDSGQAVRCSSVNCFDALFIRGKKFIPVAVGCRETDRRACPLALCGAYHLPETTSGEPGEDEDNANRKVISHDVTNSESVHLPYNRQGEVGASASVRNMKHARLRCHDFSGDRNERRAVELMQFALNGK